MDLSFERAHTVRTGLCTIALMVGIVDVGATPAFYSVDLRSAVQEPLPAPLIPYVSYVVPPYLYALDGQPDSEGPVNYDVFVAFNRVVSGLRMGAGVGKVEMCLGTDGDSSCFIPEPGTLPLAVAGLVALGFGRRWNSSRSPIV